MYSWRHEENPRRILKGLMSKKRISTKLMGVVLSLSLLSSLAVGIVPAMANVSSATVTIDTGEATISRAASGYTVRFQLNTDLEAADTITIVFPTDTAIAAGAVAGATIQAGPGWVAGVWTNSAATTAGTTFVGTVATRTVLVTVDGAIGESAEVRIYLPAGITNPSTAGSYTLTVATSDEATAIASQEYTISVPTITALPGIVTVLNPAGVTMATFTGAAAITAALAVAGVDFSIQVGPGTYTDNPTFTAAGQTISATGTAAETVVNGNWTIGTINSTISGMTLSGTVNPTIDITATADNATISNNTIKKSGTAAAPTANETLIRYNNTAGTVPNGTITGNTIDSTLGSMADTAVIDVNQTGLTISNNTILVDATTAGADDIAIDVSAGTATISGNTITGASGWGLLVSGGTATVTTTTFDTLENAINQTGGTINVSGSTITNCGVVTGTIPAISVTAATALTITDSAITGNLDDIIQVTANANNIHIMFNDLSGNTKGIDNNDAVNTVQAPVNWWGAAAGPATGHNTGLVNADAPTGSIATGTLGAGAVNAVRILASATQSADIEPQVAATGAAWTPNATSVVALGRYTTNPGEATPNPTLANGFYDAYFVQGGGNATQVLIRLYNSAITANTVAMVWSDLSGTWAAATNQGVNTFGGFVWVLVTGVTTPSLLQLSGTPFALTEPPAATGASPQALLRPLQGAAGVDINPTFTWGLVAGATGYEFVIAEEIGQADSFSIIDYSASTTTNAHVAREALKYSTTYNWRVRAIGATTGGWTTALFTTAAAPPPPPEPPPPAPAPPPPVIVNPTPPAPPAPEIILEVPAQTQLPPVQAVPETLLWAVVGVGAVLVIAVIVLIVRTRRVV